MFYESFVGGIIDYGSILYANDPESTLALLDRAQNQGLTLSMGATKTTPIPVLQYESNISPLFLRRIQSTQKRSPILPTQICFITFQFFIHGDSRNLFPLYTESSKSITLWIAAYTNRLKSLEIFHEWPTPYTHQTNSNAAPSRVSHGILPNQPLCNSRKTLHIYTLMLRKPTIVVQSLPVHITISKFRANSISLNWLQYTWLSSQPHLFISQMRQKLGSHSKSNILLISDSKAAIQNISKPLFKRKTPYHHIHS